MKTMKTERKYWQNGIRYDKLFDGSHFLHIYFKIFGYAFSICQPNRGNDILTIYKLI